MVGVVLFQAPVVVIPGLEISAASRILYLVTTFAVSTPGVRAPELIVRIVRANGVDYPEMKSQPAKPGDFYFGLGFDEHPILPIAAPALFLVQFVLDFFGAFSDEPVAFRVEAPK